MDTQSKPEFTAYIPFDRDEWAALRSNTPLTLSHEDLETLHGVNEQVSLDDVVEIYLPLSRLLNLHVRSARGLSGVKDEFLGRLVGRRPRDPRRRTSRSARARSRGCCRRCWHAGPITPRWN